MLLVGIGLVAGVAGALQLTRWIKTLLFQVQPTRCLRRSRRCRSCCSAAALLACLVPARKASRIDPQTALRAD